jgi:hypothetical protein
MASSKLSALADLAGGQVPGDLAYLDDVSAGAAGSKKSSLNDLFAIITKNITDLTVAFQDGAAGTVSAAAQGKIRYNNGSSVFQVSINTAAYDTLATLAANQTWSGQNTYGSAPVDQAGIPMSQARRLRMSDGTDGAPLTTPNPSLSFQRYDGNTDAALGTIAYTFSLTRKTGNLRSASYNMYARSFTEDTAVAHETAGYYAALGGSATAIGSIKGFIADVTCASTSMPLALGMELDPKNATGATNGALSATIPAGSAIGLAIAPGTAGAGSTNITAGILFQNGGSTGGAGTPAMRTGIHFDTTCVAAAGYAIDFKFLTQGIPVRLRNAANGIFGRNAADNADVDLLKINGDNSLGLMTAGGNVGIGTTTPGRLLSISAAANPGLKITNSTSAKSWLIYLRTGADKQLSFFDEDAGFDRFIVDGLQSDVLMNGLVNGQFFNIQSQTELTTINAAASTDTTITIPANAVVFGVSVRVTVVIPTAVTFDVGVAGATTRYGTGISTAANTTNPGTNDATRFYAAGTAIRITPNAVPGANTGRVRVTIHYYTITPPAS